MLSRLLLLASAFLAAGAFAGEHWPQFRGPNGEGHSDARGVPIKWSETENVTWKTAIHDRGWSSPVIWGNQVWLTTARADGKEMFAVCIDRNKGTIVHDLKVFDVPMPAFCHAFNSYASPTPVIEEGRVYVHFGTYGTACLDTATGKKLWERRDFPCDHFRGPGSSPILYGNLLIAHYDGFDVQFVVALDKNTGATVWRKDRAIAYGTDNGDFKKAYATPRVIEVNGQPQLISPAAVATIAYDPRTGDEIWKVYHGGMNAAQPPQYTDGKVLLNSGDGGLKLLAVRPDGRGDVTRTHIEWKNNKGGTSRTAPIVIDDGMYTINEGGILTRLGTRTGELSWQARLGGKFSASPLYVDGRLYLFSEEGKSLVGEVGKAWKELAANTLADGCMATPAIAGKALFIRTKSHLYRIEQRN